MKILTKHEEILLERRMKRGLEKIYESFNMLTIFAKEKPFKSNPSKESFKQEKSTTTRKENKPIGRIIAKTRTNHRNRRSQMKN